MFKVCNKCKNKKDFNEFYYLKYRESYSSFCKECIRKRQLKYISNNYEKAMKSNRDYQTKNVEKIRKIKQKWKKNNPEYVKKENKLRSKKIKNWRKRNRKTLNEKARNRINNDINSKIRCRLRSRLSSAVKDNIKHGSAVKDLGCSLEEFKRYLKDKFYNNPYTGEMMSFDNYGKWHLDHIKPLSSFDLSDKKQFLKACHYTNIQPLWAKDNLNKSNRLNWEN